MTEKLDLPSPQRSLSARLLVLTVAFVLLGEVLIYVPSIARFRRDYLDQRIAAAHLATLSLQAAGGRGLDPGLEAELLSHAGVLSVTLREPAAELMLGKLPAVQSIIDLRAQSAPVMIAEAFDTLWHGGERTIRVIGPSPQRPAVLVDISLREAGLWDAMVSYSWRILTLSIVISLLTAFLVYAALQLMIVRPLRRITESVIAFRRLPEDASTALPASPRGDELGLVQTELRRMQEGLRAALAQKTRLAALGSAISKINHDLRNLLANAMLLVRPPRAEPGPGRAPCHPASGRIARPGGAPVRRDPELRARRGRGAEEDALCARTAAGRGRPGRARARPEPGPLAQRRARGGHGPRRPRPAVPGADESRAATPPRRSPTAAA